MEIPEFTDEELGDLVSQWLLATARIIEHDKRMARIATDVANILAMMMAIDKSNIEELA